MDAGDLDRIHGKLDKIDERTQVMAIDIAGLKVWSRVWRFLATTTIGGMFAFMWSKCK